MCMKTGLPAPSTSYHALGTIRLGVSAACLIALVVPPLHPSHSQSSDRQIRAEPLLLSPKRHASRYACRVWTAKERPATSYRSRLRSRLPDNLPDESTSTIAEIVVKRERSMSCPFQSRRRRFSRNSAVSLNSTELAPPARSSYPRKRLSSDWSHVRVSPAGLLRVISYVELGPITIPQIAMSNRRH